jgi:hypothetical protein
MTSAILIALTGLAYAVIGVEQAINGKIPQAMIWFGYSFAQAGLWWVTIKL